MSGAMPIYLDHHATTPADPRVIEAMLPWFGHRFGNPHSVDHEWGWQAEEAVEQARRQVADLVGAAPSEVIFTSGATEANNLALLGLAPALRSLAATRNAGPPHIVASPFEHACVAACLEVLQQDGFAVTRLPAGPDGVVEPRALAQALTRATVLVTVIAASHEIGTIQPLAALAGLCWEAGAVLHSDAAQAAGKIPFDIATVNLATLSAHKIYGPKGIGALVVRGAVRQLLRPILHGGGQEGGLRSGTVPVPLAVGFGVAASIAAEAMAAEGRRLKALRTRLLAGLAASGLDFVVNGELDRRLPGNLSLRFAGIDAATLIAGVRDRIAISAGAACASAVREPSPGLLALGLDAAQALATIRIGLGRSTTEAEIDAAIAALSHALSTRR